MTAGIMAAGSSPTAASFITGLRAVKDFDGWGMYGSHTINFSQYGNVAGGVGPGNCMYVAKLSGTTFTTLSGAGPICGTEIPGLKANTGA